MKTIRWLKVSVVLQAVFAFFCVASLSLFAIVWHFNFNIFVLSPLDSILTVGWAFNPVGFVTLIVGLILYLIERKSADNRAMIGRKWIWFPLFFVIDVLLYFTSLMLMVGLTGGV